MAALTQQDTIDTLVARAESPEIADTLRNTLNGYFAAAVMMPYRPFLDAARKLRYDLDLLGRRFGVSFEQVCHRLTTLNRPSDRGIPFFFIRIDPAGNVSKRLSVGKMQFARYGGTRARWVVHKAFRVPSKVLTQVAELEEGQRVLPWHGQFLRNGHRRISLRLNSPSDWDAISNMHVRLSTPIPMISARQPVRSIGIGCHVCSQ